jgi:hypothetical protein
MIITRSYYWEGPPIPVGGAWFIAGTDQLDSGFQALPIPDWMPEQVFISRLWAGYEYDETSVKDYMAMEIEAWVDPHGASYFSTTPPGQEANYQRTISVMQVYDKHPVQEVLRWSEDYTRAPILWDRSKNDLFAIKFACSESTVWSAMEIQFQVDENTPIPTTVGSSY